MTDRVRPLIEMALHDDLVGAEAAQLAGEWPLCFFFNLQPGDPVIVAGCYQGKVLELLIELYPGIRLYGFDPQEWAAERASERVKTLGRLSPVMTPVAIASYGLGVEDGRFPMGEWNTDAASLINVGPGSRDQGRGKLVEIGRALDSIGLDRVALMVLNVEGYEFFLLRHMRATGLLDRFDKLAIQWHLDLGEVKAASAAMDDEISFLANHGLRMVVDLRPAWTYHERRV